MRVNQLLGMGACFAMLALTGCMDKDVYDPGKDPTVLKPESEYFDFTTTTNVAFEVNYGEIGSNALIEIFTEDPISYNETGSFVIQGEPVYKIFADAKGRFVGDVELPTAAKVVYVFSPTWGVPMCVEADVENGKVTVNETDATSRAAAATRAESELRLVTVNSAQKVYSLVEIDGKYGKPKDINKLIDKKGGDFGQSFIDNVQKALWKGKSTKPGNLDNRNYVRDTERVNTTIAETYQDEHGQTVTVTDAELFFTFLTESGWNQNVVGYYYYKTNECPDTPSGVTKIVIFPNASITGNVPYSKKHAGQQSGGYYDYGKKNAPLKTNQRVQLLFQDNEGHLSTKFPAGYTIGYFIIADGFKCGEDDLDDAINTKKSFVYSNKEWNKNYEGQQARFISLTAKGGTVVYGVEDGGDTSYEDVLFCIDANPNEAIFDPDRPVIDPDPDEPEVSETENTYLSFAYEDIWPSGGDYDLNDVIIEYHRSITFNKDNYVSEVKETYEPVQRDDAATNRNAFAVQYATDQRGEIVWPSGAVDETQTNSIILFSNAMDVINQKFVITRTFAAGAMKKDALKVGNSVLNPYIIVNYEGAGKDNRTEVHLPKSKATNLANSDQIGKEADAYYVNKDGKHPFAISIPGTFTPVTETVIIDKEYPDFEKWVESDGKEYTDWYKNYQKSAN